MQLFSKRNEVQPEKPTSFLKESLRKRLLRELEYLSSTDEFLERCFLVEDEKNLRWFLEDASMRDLSTRELGYDITDFFNFRNFSSRIINESFNDYALFDLIEIILVFSKEAARVSIRERFQKHFLEEGNDYMVHDFLITQKNISGLKPFISFLKDKTLKDKLEQYYFSNTSKNYGVLAKISAEIIQFLFSGDKNGETKSYTTKLVKELAEKSVEKKHVKEFSDLLNNVIINAKSLNNEISNIRHTDRSTLLVDNPSLFKLIATNNFYLAELVIFANPEKYFFSQKAIDVKNEYIAKYKIPITGWIIRKSVAEGEIDPDDIPF